jgi:hypothetical protein
VIRAVCYTASALCLGGAGAYFLYGSDKGLAIFLILIAAIVCRVLILNVAEREPRDPEA